MHNASDLIKGLDTETLEQLGQAVKQELAERSKLAKKNAGDPKEACINCKCKD